MIHSDGSSSGGCASEFFSGLNVSFPEKNPLESWKKPILLSHEEIQIQ